MSGDRKLVVGLLNNMPDRGLSATHRQFTALFDRAAPSFAIAWRCTSLPGIARSLPLPAHYLPLHVLRDDPPDALIISGAEPMAADLAGEPYWGSLAAILDWAAAARIPMLLSCLAAHAAVLRWHGIRRLRLPRKCSGVYRQSACANHAVLAATKADLFTPQSRWHDVPPGALSEAGYQTITASPQAGVDLFIHPSRPGVMFLNGHPEYDPAALIREYRRDIARFLRRETETYPDLPAFTFAPDMEQLLAAFRTRAEAARDDTLLADFPAGETSTRAVWYPLAEALARTWLAQAAPA